MEQAHARTVTYRELRRYPDDGIRRELIDGEVIEMPSPAVDHQTIVMRLLALLYNHVIGHNLGFVFPAPIDVYLDPRNVPQPDLVYVSRANKGIVRRGNLHGAPDLCVEVISPSTTRRDRVTKRALYERFRVPEYWVIDPIARTLEMLGLPDTEAPHRRRVSYVALDASRVLAGLELDREALFAPAFPD